MTLTRFEKIQVVIIITIIALLAVMLATVDTVTYDPSGDVVRIDTTSVDTMFHYTCVVHYINPDERTQDSTVLKFTREGNTYIANDDIGHYTDYLVYKHMEDNGFDRLYGCTDYAISKIFWMVSIFALIMWLICIMLDASKINQDKTK